MALDFPNYREILAEHSAAWSDYYALTMGQALHNLGEHKTNVTMHGYIRKNPFGGSYTLTGGQGVVLEHLEKHWGFDDQDCENMRLETVMNEHGLLERVFTDDYIQECATMKMDLTIDCMPEGEVAFQDEPIYRVHGPADQAFMIEAMLLNCGNSQSLFATLGSRIQQVAGGAPVLEFGLRRSQDVGGLAPSRGSFIGGVLATSNNLAHKYYGIPRRGTFAHAWVMMHEDEVQAFTNYAKAMPHSGIFLVDTYDTVEGVKKAIEVCKEHGVDLKGIRLDSGDLAYLSQEARRLMDEAGFPNAKVTASNDLDEKTIESLIQQGAKIDAWGVGTNLVTSKSQPALGMVYKLGAVYDGNLSQEMIDEIRRSAKAGENPNDPNFIRKVIKLSQDSIKVTIPGELDVLRYVSIDADGNPLRYDGDTIISNFAADPIKDGALARDIVSVQKHDASLRKTFNEGTRAFRPLVRAMEQGKRVLPQETIHDARQRAQKSLSMLDDAHKRTLNPHTYVVGLEHSLYQEREQMIARARGVEL